MAAALRRVHDEAYHKGEYFGQENLMSADEILALARAAGVTPVARVLDLCCGRGGPALHLAQEKGCQIVGVDRSPEAIYLARAAAERRGLGRHTAFLVADAEWRADRCRAQSGGASRTARTSGSSPRVRSRRSSRPPASGRFGWRTTPRRTPTWYGVWRRRFAAVGTVAYDELIATHERWVEWLGASRVRKLALVTEHAC